jgi:hypothetical protein
MPGENQNISSEENQNSQASLNDDSFQDFTIADDVLSESELMEANFSPTKKEQPPQEEENTSGDSEAKANAKDETGEGSEEKSNPEDLEQPPTSDSKQLEEGEKAPENKWSEEQRKWMESKGYSDIPFSDSVLKMLQSSQEAEKRTTDLSKEVSNLNSRFRTIHDIIVSGDMTELGELAKHIGADLNFDTRTNDDRIKEITDNYNNVAETFDPLFDRLKQVYNQAVGAGDSERAQLIKSVSDAVNSSLNSLYSSSKEQIDDLKMKSAIDNGVSRKLGIDPKSGKRSSWYSNLSENAKNAFTELRKLDPKADDFIKEIETLMGPESAFEGAGWTVAKQFGQSPQLAQAGFKIGKALNLLRQFESGDLEKGFMEKFKKEYGNQIGVTAGNGKKGFSKDSNNKEAPNYDWQEKMMLNGF